MRKPLLPHDIIKALPLLAQETVSPNYKIVFSDIGSKKGNAWYDLFSNTQADGSVTISDRFSFQVASVTENFKWPLAQVKAKQAKDQFESLMNKFWKETFAALGVKFNIRNHEPDRETREDRYFKVEMYIFPYEDLPSVPVDEVQQLREEVKLLREQLSNQDSSESEEPTTTVGSPRAAYIKKDAQRRVIKRALRKNDEAIAQARQALEALGMNSDTAFRRVIEFINSGYLK